MSLTTLLALSIATMPPTDTFEFQNWFTAVINGTAYSSSTALPQGWSATGIAGTANAKVGALMSAVIKKNLASTVTVAAQGHVKLQYKVTTDRSSGVLGVAYGKVYATANTTASGHQNVFLYGGSASFKAMVWICRVNFGFSSDSFEATPDGPRPRRLQTSIPPGGWISGSGGTHYAYFYPKMDKMTVRAQAKNTSAQNPPPNGQSQTVAEASAAAEQIYVPQRLGFSQTAVATFSTDSWVELLDIEVRNAGGSLVDLWTTDAASGSGSLLMDEYTSGTYTLIAKTYGSLTKRITVNFVPGVGVYGLNLQFKYGDLNGDNYVSASEVSYVQSLIGTDVRNAAAAGTGTQANGFSPIEADFNLDGWVTNADYQMALPNQGTYGE